MQIILSGNVGENERVQDPGQLQPHKRRSRVHRSIGGGRRCANAVEASFIRVVFGGVLGEE